MINKTIIEFGFRTIWRIMEIKEDNTLLDLHNSSDDTKADFTELLIIEVVAIAIIIIIIIKFNKL